MNKLSNEIRNLDSDKHTDPRRCVVRGAMPSLPNTLSWYGAPLRKNETQGQLYLQRH